MATLADKTIEQINTNERKYMELRNKWRQLYDRYENTERPGSITEKTTSKVKLAQAFSIVEQSVASTLARAPRFQFLSRQNKDYNDVQKYQEFISYQWDKNNADDALDEIYRWAVITGLAGWKVGWERTEKVLKSKKDKTIKNTVVSNPVLNSDKRKEDKDTEVDSNWTLMPIKPFDLIWNVEATCADDATLLAHRQTMKIEDLEAYGFDTKKLRNVIITDESYWDSQIDKYETDEINTLIEEMDLNVYECYVTEKQGDKIFEKIIWIAGGEGITNTKVLLEESENPFDDKFKAIGVYRPTKIPNKFFGYGLIEPVADILDAEEDTYNMSLEAVWTDVSKPMEYNPSNILSEAGIEYGPRKLIPVKRLGESVNVLPTPQPNTGNTSFALGFLEKNKQNVTAITDYQTGADKIGGDQTATEVQIKTYKSDQRSNKLHKTMERELLNPLAQKVLKLNKQYFAGKKNIKYSVRGKGGVMNANKINFKDIDGIEDVLIVRGSTTAVIRSQEMNKWMNLWQIGTQAMQMGIKVDLQEILRAAIEEGMDVASPEVYLPSLKEQEKAGVEDKMKQLEHAKKENEDPMTARVAETDNHEIHVEVHKASLGAKGYENKKYSPEEMQALTTHMNDHVRQAGGVVPSHQQAAEQGVAEGVAQAAAPQQANQ